jgi:hypothetical protein
MGQGKHSRQGNHRMEQLNRGQEQYHHHSAMGARPHRGVAGNEKADEYAKRGARNPREGTPSSSRRHQSVVLPARPFSRGQPLRPGAKRPLRGSAHGLQQKPGLHPTQDDALPGEAAE